MNKYLKYPAALMLIQLFTMLNGCSDDVDCDGFPSKFAITGISVTESQLGSDGNLFNGIDLDSRDTVAFDSVYLKLNASFETLSYVRKGGFGNMAFACSPVSPTPLDTVSSIQVFSLQQTGVVSFQPVEDLTDFFDIVSFTEDGGFTGRAELSQFNKNERSASTTYFLFPVKEPEEITLLGFKMITTLTSGIVFETSSKFINLK